MENWTPAEYLHLIDTKFYEAKKNKVSRYSVEWGTWSREMNLILKKRTKKTDQDISLKLKYVFVYWILKSQVLEMFYRSKILRIGKRIRLETEADAIKDIIVNGKGTSLSSFEDIAKMMV
uniref:Uncharacterized protein n=1 Tax=viral metagenome TaxID=1070528 RepID=A0A6M3KHJ0_9ZZZZ